MYLLIIILIKEHEMSGTNKYNQKMKKAVVESHLFLNNRNDARIE